MDKSKESSDKVSLSSISNLDKFKEEKYRKIAFRTLKRGREVNGREYLYAEEENR
jgi:hypothetical protein